VIVPAKSRSSTWLALPKGHPDGDESPLEARVREVREETGVVAARSRSSARSSNVRAQATDCRQRVSRSGCSSTARRPQPRSPRCRGPLDAVEEVAAEALTYRRRARDGQCGRFRATLRMVGSPAVAVLNFYSSVFADQLRRGRKTATIRLGDKSTSTARTTACWSRSATNILRGRRSSTP